MKRPALIVSIVLLAGLTVFAAAGLFRSEEERIRAVFVEASEAYDVRDLDRCLASFDPSFVDRSGGEIDRDRLTELLARALGSQLRSRVRIVDDTFHATVNRKDPSLAIATFEMRIELRGRAGWVEQWRVLVDANLSKRDEGWRIVASEHETVLNFTELADRLLG